MHQEPVRLRNYQAGDRDALYQICLRTANNGQDATTLFSDPELPGHVYVAPYFTFEPQLAFVAEDAEGIGGYLVAALDSQAFEGRLEKDWWPGLRSRYPEPSPDALGDLSLAEQYTIHHIHHPFGGAEAVTKDFPSHLHINLIPRMQGRGTGRRLVETLLSHLRASGSPGLHLLVGGSNQRAIGFYRHIGMTELPIGAIHTFTMRLTDGSASSR